MKREAVIAGLASEGLALILSSAKAGSSVVVGSMPTDPVEFVSQFDRALAAGFVFLT